MRLVIQRVSRASVSVEGRPVSSIGRGLLVLLAVERKDTPEAAAAAAAKTAGLRIFPDGGDDGSKRMNCSVLEAGGEVLVVSQFTLAASVRRGRRPSFDGAAPSGEAQALCDHFVRSLEGAGLSVQQGEFGAMMDVELVNDGPVTIWMEVSASGEIGP